MMRAKMRINLVEKFEGSERLSFSAVCANEFDENGEDENNTYAKYTPQADLTMTIANENLLGKFEGGQEFYVDFTPVK